MTRIGDTFRRIKAVIIESKSTRSVLLYLFFVVVSTVLWYIMTANNVISLEFKIPINITDVPENVRFLNPTPDTVTVTVQDKGSSFIKWMFSAKPSVNLRFEDYSDDNGQFRLDAAQSIVTARPLRPSPKSTPIMCSCETSPTPCGGAWPLHLSRELSWSRAPSS